MSPNRNAGAHGVEDPRRVAATAVRSPAVPGGSPPAKAAGLGASPAIRERREPGGTRVSNWIASPQNRRVDVPTCSSGSAVERAPLGKQPRLSSTSSSADVVGGPRVPGLAPVRGSPEEGPGWTRPSSDGPAVGAGGTRCPGRTWPARPGRSAVRGRAAEWRTYAGRRRPRPAQSGDRRWPSRWPGRLAGHGHPPRGTRHDPATPPPSDALTGNNLPRHPPLGRRVQGLSRGESAGDDERETSRLALSLADQLGEARGSTARAAATGQRRGGGDTRRSWPRPCAGWRSPTGTGRRSCAEAVWPAWESWPPS